jgi:hypothetical protein
MKPDVTYYYRRRFGEAYAEAFECLKNLHAESEIPHFDDWSKVGPMLDVLRALAPLVPMLEHLVGLESEKRVGTVWFHPKDDSLDLHVGDLQVLLDAYRRALDV